LLSTATSATTAAASLSTQGLNVSLELGLQVGMETTQTGHARQAGEVGQVGKSRADRQTQLRLHQILHVSGRFGLPQQRLMDLHFLFHITAVLFCRKK
jgi:hypothetical protein